MSNSTINATSLILADLRTALGSEYVADAAARLAAARERDEYGIIDYDACVAAHAELLEAVAAMFHAAEAR